MNLKAVKAKKEILDKFQNLSLIMQIDNNDKRLVEEENNTEIQKEYVERLENLEDYRKREFISNYKKWNIYRREKFLNQYSIK